ncbi:hypothetical protein LTR97_004727 [Elasticomyces elasticus]|uniref:BTB domain-containing protein n=1 Tax=Elasticomyces elasticus TaxID=574655 RepID=A0AAN8A3K4_9PEZI|nr:hypothetical protein LTR97_004727 [Elasticomyces elasticus]
MAGKRKAAEADVNSKGGPTTRLKMTKVPGHQAVADSLRFTDTIDVHVGPDKTRFSIPKALLRFSSKFFDGAIRFNEQNKNGDKPIELIEEDPFTFDLYLHTLYSIKFGVMEEETAEAMDEWFMQYVVEVYVLAIFLQDERAADTIMHEALSHVIGCRPRPETKIEVWKRTPDKCTLRHLLVDSFVFEMKPEWLRYYLDADNFPGDLARAIAQRYAALAVDKPLDWLTRITEHRLLYLDYEAYSRGDDIDRAFSGPVEQPAGTEEQV